MLRASVHSNVVAYYLPGTVEDEAVYGLFEEAERRDNPEAYLQRALGALCTDLHETHNLITTAGLTALAYNCTASDGDVLEYFLVGSGTTAPALTDTTMATLLATYEDYWSITSRYGLVVGYYLTGPKRDARDGDTISEIGLKTGTGSGKGSDNVLFARAVLYTGDQKAIDTTLSVVYLWSITIEAGASAADQPMAFAREYFASRIFNVSTYGAVSHIAVGTGTTKNKYYANELLAEATPRQSFTFTPSGGSLSASGTITATTVGGTLAEIGPAVGTGSQVLYQSLPGTTSDNDANNTAVSCTITFANVVTADALLIESGDGILIESGDALLMES